MKSNSTTVSNRLKYAKSPYLKQHADNPVDWWPWCDDAFVAAQEADIPIFLSIGYSTCHWCHVMAHESFENKEVAHLMNKTFVNIKVDREERPDIDALYMTVCQMMTGSAGWPLSIIMTPDKKPFFAATYIPKCSRQGHTGMLDLIPRVQQIWRTKHDHILQSADKVASALTELRYRASSKELPDDILHGAYQTIAERFDSDSGGFGSAPKFPTPHILMFLLRYWKQTTNEQALHMVTTTLDAMRKGGIYDHIGFGFHRYSTDAHWLVPHFEKMLYDQAQLALVYTEAFQVTGNKYYRDVAYEIYTYVLRDLTSPHGAFYSAQDADSEGLEGKYYLWTTEELDSVLGEDAPLIKAIFSVDDNGNYRDEANRNITGNNILHISRSREESAAACNLSPEQIHDKLTLSRTKLLEYRSKRIRPFKDEKVLTDWNGLMIAALARSAFVFDDPELTRHAQNAARFVFENLYSQKDGLLHRYIDGDAAIAGYLDDYAFFIWGLTELYCATFDESYLQQALMVTDEMMNKFYDNEQGGFFLTAENTETLFVRNKELYDGATPSGNSVASYVLLKLGRLTGQVSLEETALRTGKTFRDDICRTPSAYTFFMTALLFAWAEPSEIILSGVQDDPVLRELVDELRKRFLPFSIMLMHHTGTNAPTPIEQLKFLSNYTQQDHKACAYICKNWKCMQPMHKKENLIDVLNTI